MRRTGTYVSAVAVVAAVAVAVLFWPRSTSSTDSSSPVSHVTPTATSSPSEEARQKARALAAYDATERALVQLRRTDDVDAARTLLPAHMSSLARLDAIVDLRRRQTAGVVMTGEPTWTATVASITLTGTPKATLTVCYDATGYHEVSRATGKNTDPPGSAARYQVTVTVSVYADEKWYVDAIEPHPSKPC
jgi:hypothetical protein